MEQIEWIIQGAQYANCNCAWGCPCQFNALPTYGDCHTLVAMRIDKGRFDDTVLDNLCWVGMYSWPGAIHEGNGTQQFVIDERADKKQRHALVEIVHGRESDPGATIFQVFATTMTKVLDPLFLPIELAIDVDECRSRVAVPALIESEGTPMISPFSGEPHRATVSLRSSLSFTQAEFGSGTTKATGAVPLDFEDSYGQFNYVHIDRRGPIRSN